MKYINDNKINSCFGQSLIKWYNQNKRDLPWRNTVNPYKIWLSEIILQQTRVVQGYDYYMKFVENYPTIKDLAAASEHDVLKLWQGLGYYSRARNLRATAKEIVDKYDGTFPSDYKALLSLKGIGSYTASAILSFAYNMSYAVVDGNVYRVLSRVFAIEEPIDTTQGKKLFEQLAQSLIEGNEPCVYNQAIMDFGALQCVPVSPDCSYCCLQNMCLGLINNKVSLYPRKNGKPKSRDRYFNYFDIRYQDTLYITKRGEKDVWQNLYEYPLIETDSQFELESLLSYPAFIKLFENTRIDNISQPIRIKHVLSHQNIYASFYQIQISSPLQKEYKEINKLELDDYPMAKLIHKYREKIL